MRLPTPRRLRDIVATDVMATFYNWLFGSRRSTATDEAAPQLDALLAQLAERGVSVTPSSDDEVTFSFRFAFDPDDNFATAAAHPAAPSGMDAGTDVVGAAKRQCEASFEECQAANRMACPYHGAQFIKASLLSRLARFGARTSEVELVPDKKGGGFSATVKCVASPQEKKAVADAINDFLNARGVTAKTGAVKPAEHVKGEGYSFGFNLAEAAQSRPSAQTAASTGRVESPKALAARRLRQTAMLADAIEKYRKAVTEDFTAFDDDVDRLPRDMAPFRETEDYARAVRAHGLMFRAAQFLQRRAAALVTKAKSGESSPNDAKAMSACADAFADVIVKGERLRDAISAANAVKEKQARKTVDRHTAKLMKSVGALSKTDMGWEDGFGVADVNPYYNPDDFLPDYATNCQRCIVAYELIRRGYLVTAQPNRDENYDVLRFWDKMGKNAVDCGGGRNFRRDVEKNTKRDPVGSRYCIFVTWNEDHKNREMEEGNWDYDDDGEMTFDGPDAHIFIAEKTEDGLMYIDPQNPESDADAYLDDAVWRHGNNWFCRIDNLEVSDKVTSAVRILERKNFVKR